MPAVNSLKMALKAISAISAGAGSFKPALGPAGIIPSRRVLGEL
jgi:hypothetical protein